MGILTSAARTGLVILSATLLFIFTVPLVAPILVLTAGIFSIVPYSNINALILLLTVALAIFSTLPDYIVTAPVLVLTAAYLFHGLHAEKPMPRVADNQDAPVSVNYFPSRQCNYACGFCFHTNASDYILPLDEAKRGLLLLKEAGMRKLNIAGGEPFLHPKFLGELLRYCKNDLGLESVSIISNGNKIRETWVRQYGRYLDILAVSRDSFFRETNTAIGCGENGQEDGGHLEQVVLIAGWCREYGIIFKLNTVVNIHNWNERMASQTAELAPFPWKVFQCLIVEGENENETRVRDAREFLISQEQWEVFCDRHKHLPCFVPDDKQTMAGSYLLLDERMRFLDKGDGPMKKSDSLLDVGVKKSMQQVAWDKGAFVKRGGIYEWRKPQAAGSAEGNCSGSDKKELEW